jgi:hypothetical protein
MRTILLGLVAAIVLLSAGLAGTYKGTFSGSSGSSGDITVSLTQSASGEWKSEVTFTLGGDTVKTKVTSLKVNSPKFTVVYTFDLQGTVLESTVAGELKDGALSGDYHTKALADGSAVDDGTWKATAQ